MVIATCMNFGKVPDGKLQIVALTTLVNIFPPHKIYVLCSMQHYSCAAKTIKFCLVGML